AQAGRLHDGRPVAPSQQPVRATSDGYVASIDALAVGIASLELGAGRARKEDRVDPAAGLVIEAQVGARVKRGDALVTVHAGTKELVAKVTERRQHAWRLPPPAAKPPPHVLAGVHEGSL